MFYIVACSSSYVMPYRFQLYFWNFSYWNISSTKATIIQSPIAIILHFDILVSTKSNRNYSTKSILFHTNISLSKESLNSDSHQVHQYQQNEQSPHTVSELTEHKKVLDWDRQKNVAKLDRLDRLMGSPSPFYRKRQVRFGLLLLIHIIFLMFVLFGFLRGWGV